MTSIELATALLLAVKAQGFGAVADGYIGGAQTRHFPSIDLAVVAFPEAGAPVAANVLFSREHPDGIIAEFKPNLGPLTNVRFDKDQRDAKNNSVVWAPDTHWSQLSFTPLAGEGPHRFVAPYPASLIKVMVLVGVALQIDAGRTAWDAAWTYNGITRSVREWCDLMTVISSNEATSAMTALLHKTGAIVRDADGETSNAVNAAFTRYGLTTLRLDNTKPDGGWMNPADAGVGQLHMTAWDSARLMWLLDEAAPAAPWLAANLPPLLAPATRREVRAILEEQALHEILSSTALAGVEGWVPGMPTQLPARWIQPDGSVKTPDHTYPADVRGLNAKAELRFAHKTGTTENYVADAGIVTGINGHTRHYLIAVIASLGTRYAPNDCCATTWRLPALGAAIDAYLKPRLEAKH